MQRTWIYCLGLLAILAFPSLAQTTFPLNDVSSPRSQCYAFINAHIVKDANTEWPKASLVIRKGKIEQVGPQVTIPKEAVIIDLKGKYVYPSFIDAYSDYGSPEVKPGGRSFRDAFQNISNTKGPYAWNQAIKSEVNAAQVFSVQDAKASEWRKAGFAVVLTHQMDGISRGTGVLVSLAKEKENLVMLKEKASAHYSFDKGSSTQDYPNSLMGSIALLRQNFLDAQWYKSKPQGEGNNLSLQAFNANLSLPQIFEVNDKWSVLRADKIGDEFGVQYIIKASGNEYQRMEEMKSTKANFILPLAFPTAMDLEDPHDARFVPLSDLKHWELAPGNPAAFEQQGISFALTAHGIKDMSQFLPNLRKAIQFGLSEKKALEALTSAPANFLGVADQLGSLDIGKWANFTLSTGPIFEESSVMTEQWIQGQPYVLNSAWQYPLAGTYQIQLGNERLKLEVKGQPGAYKAQLMGKDSVAVDLSQKDQLIAWTFSSKADAGKKARLSGSMVGDAWEGAGTLASGAWVHWKAERLAGPASDSTRKSPRKAEERGALVFPFNGYGQKTPAKTETILIRNATVWTNENAGVLSNTDVVLKGGKIVKIGKNLQEAGARIIDGTGKHLTPGIIDEHSHVAATGGINECSQSVTAEVRIADVIDPEDVDIYRQLSGGVTSSHILHGSCNTIGGQTQLLKFRWGQNAEQLKFAGWDPFIKFALGENVKRSYNPSNLRFPDTRMGVEQVLVDAFTRARDYEKQGPGKRVDLELETLSEILNKKRFITCHSYVQSEINTMLKVGDRFGFTVNTFTHILEGYKVADKMKAHGANASTFSDWWNYKMEVLDAIPQNASIMQGVGLNVAINSDDAEMARRLNQEAAKSVKYANMDEQAALKMVTLNPAKMLHVADRVGSIKPGKDADVVLWSDHPLSIYAKAEHTIVDGAVVFDRSLDLNLQSELQKEKQRLVQKMLQAKKSGASTRPFSPNVKSMNQCEDDHDHEKSLWERIAHRSVSGESTTSND